MMNEQMIKALRWIDERCTFSGYARFDALVYRFHIPGTERHCYFVVEVQPGSIPSRIVRIDQ
jgi:hypothetical protein